MKVSVNGKNREIPESTALSVQGFLVKMGYVDPQDQFFAIAVNMEFVPKSAYGELMLREGDQIEIVSPTAGG